jgi:mycothione reductase
MNADPKAYDVVVIGSGSGAIIVDSALYQGWTVGWVDRGPLGGTCLNVGCIPSKQLIYPADRIMEIREARKLGIDAEVIGINFRTIMERMRRVVRHSQESIREGLDAPGLDFYSLEGHFIGERTLQVGDARITGERVYIVSGARPSVPPIEGIEEVPYLTNETVLELQELPESLILVGGGLIAAEYGHFFATMGTTVTILQRNERLVPREEPEISALLRKRMAERMDVHTSTEVIAVRQEHNRAVAIGRNVETGEEHSFRAARLMVAAGRTSNADLLQVENAGVKTDERGYIVVNEYLETDAENVWAFGDAIGKHMFTHVANREALVAWHNSVHDHRVEMDYSSVPHAVFSHPQIASVGLTEAQASESLDILIGEAKYLDVAKGQAMMETDGFAKAILERESGKILGFHIIGPYAPILIQEVVDAMANDQGVDWVAAGLHIHPALPEVAVRTLHSLREPL